MTHQDDAPVDQRTKQFATFYREYLDDVYRYCAFRLDTREAAEDATSEVFARAFASFESFRGRGSRRSWLFSIAHNTVIDQYRRKRVSVSLDTAAELIDDRAGPESIALDSTERDEVRMLLQQLPDSQRQILELRLAGLTGVEIAEVLGRSHGAVKIAQVRAYRTLRRLLRNTNSLSNGEPVVHGTE